MKQLSGIFLVSFIGLAGLIMISTYWIDPHFEPSTSSYYVSGEDSTKYVTLSGDCITLENQLLNSLLDVEQIKEDINDLTSTFEKDYLYALLLKRSGDYERAFNSLYNIINVHTSHLRFYDELVNASKIAGTIKELEKYLRDKSESSVPLLYLSGLVNFETGKYYDAIEDFNKINDSGFNSEYVNYRLAYTYRLTGNYEKSIELLNKAESILDSTNQFLAKVINAQGSIAFLSNEYELAEQYYQNAKKIAIATGNVVQELTSLGNLAMIKDMYGDVYSAREDLSLAIQRTKELGDKDLLAFLHSELGVSFTYTNENIEARENYKRSYELYSILNNQERLSYLSSNIGAIYLQQANYNSALEYYRQGLKYSSENKLGQLLNLTGIADVYANSSNYSKAIEYYSIAKQLADSIKSISSLITIEQGIGALYYNINKPKRALSILLKAESMQDVSKYPYEATQLYYKIGTVLSSVDSIYQAQEYLNKGLEIANQSGDLYYEIILQTELAHTYYLQGNYQAALSLLKTAMTVSKDYELLQLISLQELYLGKILLARSLNSNARDHFIKSFELAEKVFDYNTQIESGYNLAMLNEKLGNLNEAENWYNRSIDIIEKISITLVQNQQIQIAHFSGFNEIYESFTDYYLHENNIIKAFEVIERSRSRNTMQNLVNLKLLSSVGNRETLDRYFDLKWMINSDLYSDEEKIFLIKEEKSLKAKFLSENPQLHADIFNSPWKNIDQIQSTLNESDNIVSVYVKDNSLFLFHLTKEDLKTYNIPLLKEDLIRLLGDVAPIYKSDLSSDEIYINQDLFSFNAEAAWKLYRSVFKELIDKIPSDERLIFSLSNELILLPVELLVVEWNENSSPFYYEDKKFLIEKHPVLYTPSASIYAEQFEKSLSESKANLLVGDPTISNKDFSVSYRSGLLSEDEYSARNIQLFPLEYSAEEIENVNAIIANNIVLLSENATEEKFKINAATSNLIHLSTHSFLYRDQPLIIFSNQDDDFNDGFLEVSEIVQMELTSDLVVLSSCRSGLGKIDNAEGVLGMQKAFFEAGASSIVVSLWDVNDKYTSYFMKDFYNYLSEGYDKPEALRKTKIEFAKKYSANPYYWSAFVLSGNPSKLNIDRASSYDVFLVLIIFLALVSMIIILLVKKAKHRGNSE